MVNDPDNHRISQKSALQVVSYGKCNSKLICENLKQHHTPNDPDNLHKYPIKVQGGEHS